MAVELRHWREDDAAALGQAIIENLEHLRPWLPWVAGEPRPTDERAELIREWERDRANGGDQVFGIFLDGRVAGSCGLHRRIGDGGLEIGYWVHVDFTRRGLASEASRRLCDRAFADPAIDRVEIHHDAENVRSGGVPRKLGFEYAGEIRHQPEAPGESGVRCVWRLTRTAWSGARVSPPAARAT